MVVVNGLATSLPRNDGSAISRIGPLLPVAELMHPVTVTSMVVLAVNDHLLKGSDLLPGLVTGKLSDFAGLLFFPLLLTALLDTLAYLAVRLGSLMGREPSLDYTLRRWKLVAACSMTALGFTAIQLSQSAVDLYTGAVGLLGFPSVVTQDPTDLVALIVLPVAYMVGSSLIERRDSAEALLENDEQSA